MTRHRVIPILLALAGLSAACAPMGPNYKRPAVTPPPVYRGAVATPDQAKSVADLPWVEMFKDPVLSALIREAIDNGLDLRQAVARVEEYRGRASLAGSSLKPFVGADFSTSGTPTNTKFDNFYSGTLFFNWEIDFFGRLRRASEAARAELLSSEWGARATMASLVSDVAQTYVTLRSLDEQRDVIIRTIASQEEWLDLVRKLDRGGVASGTEVAQATLQVTTTREQLPAVERLIVQAENALSVLLGRPPSQITRDTAGPTTLPTAPDIPAGLPSQLLERRPDIIAAEQQIHAAVARLGVSLASRIPVPRIGLTGAFGRVGTSLDDFFAGGDKAEGLVSIGPFIQMPLYDGGAGNARVRIARAQAEQAALNYRQVILLSFREVADSLVTIQKLREQIAESEARKAAAVEYLRLTDLRYRGGVSSYLEVLDAQRSLFSAEIDLAQLKGTQLGGVVQLYPALGGGRSDEELKKIAEQPMTATQ
jgi:multidrug efflux system outer membrane protein